MGLIITRGFGRCESGEIKYYPVPICEVDVESYEFGKRDLKVKELKPVMSAKPSPYYYEEILDGSTD